MSVDMDVLWPANEVAEVAKWQKFQIWLILMQGLNILIFLAGFASPQASDAVGLTLLSGRVVLAALSIVGVYKMAASLRKSCALAYAIGMILPIVCLLILLRLSDEATTVLRARGVRVGAMGADQADLDRLLTETTPAA